MAAPAPAPASAPSSASKADPADDAAEAPGVRVEKSAISSGTYHSHVETGVLYDGTRWQGARHKTKLLWSGSIKWRNGTVYTGEFQVHDEHKMTRARALKCGEGYRPFDLSKYDMSQPLIFSQHYDISAIPEADCECAESQGTVYDIGGVLMDLPDADAVHQLSTESRWPPYVKGLEEGIVVIRAGGVAAREQDVDLSLGLFYWWYARLTIQGEKCPRLFKIPEAVSRKYYQSIVESKAPCAVAAPAGCTLGSMYEPVRDEVGPIALMINLKPFERVTKVRYADPLGSGCVDYDDGSRVVGTWKMKTENGFTRTCLHGPVEFVDLAMPGGGLKARGDATYKFGMPEREGVQAGTLTFEDGRTWTGLVDNNMIPNGHGTLKCKQGVYEGTLHLKKHGVSALAVQGLEGYGTYRSSSGTRCCTYTGTFSLSKERSVAGVGRDCDSGMGGLHYVDGNTGCYCDNPYGKGCLTILVGSMIKYVYEGCVEDGYRHGLGTEFFYVRAPGEHLWRELCWRKCQYDWGIPDADYDFFFSSVGFTKCFDGISDRVFRFLREVFTSNPAGEEFRARYGDEMSGINFAERMLKSVPTTYYGKMTGDGARQWREGRGKWTICYAPDRLCNASSGEVGPRSRVVYHGDWKQNKRHGYGDMKIYPQHPPFATVSYSGQWSEDYQHGKGTYDADGTTYTGDFVYNLKQGVGTMVYDVSLDDRFKMKRASYTGEWKQNRYNGHGEMMYLNGTSYTGEWLNHKAHGMGKRLWGLDVWWEGHYDSGQKHDTAGLFRRANGDTLVGPWVRGVMHGTFTETCAATGCTTLVKYRSNRRQKTSKKRALRQAMEELDEHVGETSHCAYVKLSKRLKGVWDAVNDSSTPLESDDEGTDAQQVSVTPGSNNSGEDESERGSERSGSESEE